MKPFNLTDAIAGKPVVTRNGKPITEIHLFKECKSKYNVCAVIEGDINNFTLDGKFWKDRDAIHEYDLFMASEKKTVWVNVYKLKREDYNNSTKLSYGHFNTKEEALSYKDEDFYIATKPIEIEV